MESMVKGRNVEAEEAAWHIVYQQEQQYWSQCVCVFLVIM